MRRREPLSSAKATRTVLVASPGADLYGSDRMMLETVDALLASGDRVTVVTPGDGPLVAVARAHGATVQFCPMPVLRKSAMSISGVLRLFVSTARALIPSLAVLRRVRPDVVYVSTITVPLWFVLCRLTKRRCVCHVHEAEASTRPAVLRAINLPLALTNTVILNSEYTRAVVLGAVPRLAGKSVTIHNAVQGPQEITAARERIEGSFRVLYVGRLSPRKGPDVLIKALRMLRDNGIDADLDLVGAVFPGYEWFEVRLRQLVEDEGLGGRVHFHGFRSDVWPYFEWTDVATVPSTMEESFGNTAVEAVLAARPVVVSDIAGLAEATAVFDSAVRVRPGSVNELAEAFRRIHDDWSSYRSLARHDADVAAQRYSSTRYAKQMRAVLSRAADGRRPITLEPRATTSLAQQEAARDS